jgi:hypothetical protein
VTLKTSYEFVLPRGYVDHRGRLHRKGRMRLATARDELEPIRDPLVTGPDDPRLTILVLARVVEELGELEMITASDIEGLFAVDLAFLQDFYGVINFGTQEEYEALLEAQAASALVGEDAGAQAEPASTSTTASATAAAAPEQDGESAAQSVPPRPSLRSAVEELPRQAL